jgi:DNA-binding PadR family transcriptional regulator
VADKLTQQITDALARAAAAPTGLPLYTSKADAGLFPNAASAKPAAQKCLADELVRVVATDTRGKTQRDLYGLTEKGWEFLLAAVNPKQVLEDFVRVLEARQGEVGELLDTARRMAESLQGLKDAVARVLPEINLSRVKGPMSHDKDPRSRDPEGSAPPTRIAGALLCESRLRDEADTALLDAPPAPDLAPAVLAHLADWPGATDCPLPDLFRALSALDPAPSIGAFHDCLRKLHADGTVSLPAWTGPLYAMPEPAYALLVGHGIAYYASLRG